jgi:hypothetical protein
MRWLRCLVWRICCRLLPVYVERKYKGDPGSLSWWLPVKMDEAERVKQKVAAPDSDAWNNQMYRIRVFDELVYDTDPTNVLIGEDWKIWRIDFTRAFRLQKDLRGPNNLVRCDRQLLAKLRTLDGDQLAEKTKDYLTKDEVKAVMARRDKIVARFKQLVRRHLHPTCSATVTTYCLPPPFDGELLQIMPWPIFHNMTDHDLRAIYEYLPAIPCIAGPPAPSPLHNDCE